MQGMGMGDMGIVMADMGMKGKKKMGKMGKMGKKRHIYTRKTRLKIFSRVSNCLFYIKRKIIRIMIIMDTMVIIIMETRMDHMDIRIPILKKNSKNHKT
jgi:hypothetical protein